jgi:diguanylate cyclase (GGDEF)-like protein
MQKPRAALQRLLYSTLGLVGLGFAALLLLLALLVRQGLTQIDIIGQALEDVVSVAMPAERYATDMQRAAQNRIMLMLRLMAQPDPLERDGDAQAFEAEGLAFARARDALLALPMNPQDRASVDAQLRQAVALSQVQRQVVQALLEGRDDAARAQVNQAGVFERQRTLVQGLEEFALSRRALAQRMQQEARNKQRQAERLMLGLGATAFALGLCIGVVVARLVLRADRALQAEKAQAQRHAATDPLTGLANRRGFDAARQQSVDKAAPGTRLALLLIDLDHFKAVNDQAGHDAGDALLRRLASVLQESVRPQDVVARLGGDEFAVLLQQRDAIQAGEVAQRIVTAVRGFAFQWQGRDFRVGASVGVVCFDAADAGRNWSAIFKAADEACYRAKRDGRSRWVAAPWPER